MAFLLQIVVPQHVSQGPRDVLGATEVGCSGFSALKLGVHFDDVGVSTRGQTAHVLAAEGVAALSAPPVVSDALFALLFEVFSLS